MDCRAWKLRVRHIPATETMTHIQAIYLQATKYVSLTATQRLDNDFVQHPNKKSILHKPQTNA